MPYKIELEDHGQDLTELTVNDKTGVIEDAGLLSWVFAKGDCVVDMTQLEEDRTVGYWRNGGEKIFFKYPMRKLSLNGAVLCDVDLPHQGAMDG